MNLLEYKELKGLTYGQIGHYLGHHSTVVRRWCLPKKHPEFTIPKPDNMKKILKFTRGQVEPNSWFCLRNYK